MSLARNGAPQISADGRIVAFAVSEADWEADRNRSRLLVSIEGAEPRRAAGPDFEGSFRFCGNRIAFLVQGRRGSRLQLQRPDGRGSRQIGPLPVGTRSFSCSADGSRVAITVLEPEAAETVRQRELFGDLDIKGEGLRMTHLWEVDIDGPEMPNPPETRRLTSGDFTVGSFAFSPDGTRIAFDHAPDPRPNSSYASDVSVIELEGGERRTVAAHPGRDVRPVWSPDGSQLLYSSAGDVAVSNLPLELMVVSAHGGSPRILTEALATEPRVFGWNESGVWLTADEGTRRNVYRLDPATGEIEQISGLPEIVSGAAISADGETLAILGESRTSMGEVLVTSLPDVAPRALTEATSQVEGWPLGTREVIEWQASDGLSIEGVLFRPEGFDPSRQYPLMVVVHGGPRAVSRPGLVVGGLYPVEQWLARGALILMPNYRGSVGYGPEFRAAHHRTLGSGDAMDVLAGVDHLIAEGFVDADRIGLMGWSYGGFISAYLTATTDRFRAVSVGAGISDWRTHYAGEPANITTLVFSFGVPPYEDPEAWAAASPITHITGASTPTLIQHVDGDPTVTVLNAYELHQALEDLGVESRFIEYHGSGHGPTGLKQRIAVLWHNQQWFARHIWGEEIEPPDDGR